MSREEGVVYGEFMWSTWKSCAAHQLGCFHKLGVLFVGVLIARTLPFGFYIRAT